MQYSAHKSLTAYIREQYAPLIIIPAIIMLACFAVLITVPRARRHSEVFQTMAEAASTQGEEKSVTITTGTLYYTGLDYDSHSISRARIYYTLEDGICYFLLLTETSANRNSDILEGGTYTVALVHNDTIYETVCASMSQTLEFAEANLHEVASPVLFNQYEYKNGFLTFLVYAVHILAVLSAVGVLYCILVLIYPGAALCVRRLHRYGKPSTLFALAVAEFDSEAPIGRRNLYVTDSFFIALLPNDIIIQPLDNVVWIYQTHEVTHAHGQAKMIHTLCIVNERKKTYKIPRLSEPVIATLINAIASEHPKILVGNAWNH